MTEVWVFLHTTAEPVIIVGEEETDELITRRERNGLTGEEGWEDRQRERLKGRPVGRRKPSKCASFSSFTSSIRPPFSFSVFPMTSAAHL